MYEATILRYFHFSSWKTYWKHMTCFQSDFSQGKMCGRLECEFPATWCHNCAKWPFLYYWVEVNPFSLPPPSNKDLSNSPVSQLTISFWPLEPDWDTHDKVSVKSCFAWQSGNRLYIRRRYYRSIHLPISPPTISSQPFELNLDALDSVQIGKVSEDPRHIRIYETRHGRLQGSLPAGG